MFGTWEELAPLLTAIAGVSTAIIKISPYIQTKQKKGISMRDQSRLEQIAEEVEILSDQCDQLLKEMEKLERLLKRRERKETTSNE